MTTINSADSSQLLLSMPAQAGRAIIETSALLVCPLLGTDNFVAFCKARALDITRERLLRLERLGLFSPVFRVRMPDDEKAEQFRIPIRDGNNWFEKGWAWDTTEIPARHEIPANDDQAHEAYYSVFQIEWLGIVLSEMTLHVHLDGFLDQTSPAQQNGENVLVEWRQHATLMRETSLNHAFRPSIAMLCQYISNRYYPLAQGDQRQIRVGTTTTWDAWTSIHASEWDWEDQARRWNPQSVESFFELSASKLLHAYQALCLSQSNIDPLEDWYPLVQFISIDRRRRLKGAALQAQTLHEGALMIRSLYRDLYDQELPPPNEVGRTIITHMPELEVRKDTRRYLEFVVNRYGLNPQPKLVLIVEGETEEIVVNRIFEEVFGASLGKHWIEMLVLHGVDNATGSKQDMFRAILRLVDYLHHHQTLAYLILDNENYADKLKKEARSARSIH